MIWYGYFYEDNDNSELKFLHVKIVIMGWA